MNPRLEAAARSAALRSTLGMTIVYAVLIFPVSVLLLLYLTDPLGDEELRQSPFPDAVYQVIGSVEGFMAVAGAIALAVGLLVVLAVPLWLFADLVRRTLHPSSPPQRFVNVVEEIAIALGEPVESIQVYESDEVNIAMLPGRRQDVVVATTGALQRLSRYEMQALVAAQFAGMEDRWCRLATKAEITRWFIPFLPIVALVITALSTPLIGPLLVVAAAPWLFFWTVVLFWSIFSSRWDEQTRDFCADVAAVRTTFDPATLARAFRRMGEEAARLDEVEIGRWYQPVSPFLVMPKRVEGTTTVGQREWTSSDETLLEFGLRADRAAALATGADAAAFTGREYRRRRRRLGSGR